MIKAVRGTRDLLPPETALWNFVEAKVREVFRAYNFQEIRTPVFESTELFARGVGEDTDIVSKEMYTWEDRGRAESDRGQSLTLRPENTAGVVRAYIEHKLWDRGLNKLAGVMKDLEIVLLQTSLTDDRDPSSLQQIQRLIRRRDLIEKMDVVTTTGL